MFFDHLFFNEYFLAGTFFLFGLIFFIPISIHSFLHWKKTGKPQDFSYFIMMLWIFCFLMTPSYFFLLRDSEWLRAWVNPKYVRILNTALFVLIFFVFIPRAVHFYKKFKSSSDIKQIYAAIFLAIIVFYALSLQFCLFLNLF